MEARVHMGGRKRLSAEPWDEIIMVSPPTIPEPYTDHPELYYIIIFCSQLVMPVVIFVGIVGNVLAFFVFVSSALKRLSTSVYLAALSFADVSFLVCLGAGWMDNFRFTFFQQEVVCTLVVYLTYVFSFLSVWFVVCFTTDMYLTLFHECLVARVNRVPRARLVVCGLTLLGGCLYLHTFWTTKQVQTANGQKTCMFVANADVRMALALLDSFLTLLLPYTLLIFMNTRILLVIVGFSRQRRRSGGEGAGGDLEERLGDCSTPATELHGLEAIDELGEAGGTLGRRRGGGGGMTCSMGEDEAQPVTLETATLTDIQDLTSTRSSSEDKINSANLLRSSKTRGGSRKSSVTPKGATSSSDRSDASQKCRHTDVARTLSSFETEDPMDGDPVLNGLFTMADMSAAAAAADASSRRRQNPAAARKTTPAHKKISDLQWQSFKMLLTVVVVFLVLHLPSHTIRLQGLLRSFFTPSYVTSKVEHICQQFFQVLYYFNFIANFIIYNACAKTFRTAIASLPYVITKACRCACRCRRPRRGRKLLAGAAAAGRTPERILTTNRIGEELRRMREEQNSRLVEVNLAEMHISRIESFASDYKYQSPPCLLKRSQTEEETCM